MMTPVIDSGSSTTSTAHLRPVYTIQICAVMCVLERNCKRVSCLPLSNKLRQESRLWSLQSNLLGQPFQEPKFALESRNGQHIRHECRLQSLISCQTSLDNGRREALLSKFAESSPVGASDKPTMLNHGQNKLQANELFFHKHTRFFLQ